MSHGRKAEPLFVDTGAFYAWFKPDDEHHDRATAVFEALKMGELPYQPVYTSRYVLTELVTLSVYHVNPNFALSVFDTIYPEEMFNILPISHEQFMQARIQLEQYNDHDISFTDHLSSVLANEHDIERMFAFDSDFRTLGFTVIPKDTGEP